MIALVVAQVDAAGGMDVEPVTRPGLADLQPRMKPNEVNHPTI